MEQLMLAEMPEDKGNEDLNVQSDAEIIADIYRKYPTLNETEKKAIELNLNEGLDYKAIAIRLDITPEHCNRIMHYERVANCITDLKAFYMGKNMKELTEVATDEAKRMILDRNTPAKVKSELIRHVLPEGKRGLDLNLGQNGIKNW